MKFSAKGLIGVAVLFALSLFGAWVLYGLLESFADGVWAGFRLGGAGAGFVVVFLLLHWAYERSLGRSVVKVQLNFAGDQIPTGLGDDTACVYSLFNRESLERTAERPAELLREGAGLVFYVESNSPADLIRVALRTADGTRWESGHHPLYVTPIEMGNNGS